MINVYYSKDVDSTVLKSKNIVIFGYGSQGHAHALNLKESGYNVSISLRPGSKGIEKAKAQGFKVFDNNIEAAKTADIAMILIPDELQKELYDSIQAHLPNGCSLAFGHGFNIHYGRIVPRVDMNVFLVAPKGPGHLVRSQFAAGMGVPCLFAIHQDKTGQARQLAMAYAAVIGGGRAGMIETNFKDETETDLFGEQAVLCGGISHLIMAGFETLTEAGYPEEMAYFECLHETKLIVDLIYEAGLANMRYSISNTAEYGDYVSGPRVIDAGVKERMKQILKEVQDGTFAKKWIAECESGYPNFNKMREATKNHPIEKVGAKLRGMMPWLKGGVQGKDTA